jgi:hypothetical protein
MKKFFFWAWPLILLSCKELPNTAKNGNSLPTGAEVRSKSHYPEALLKVFEAHGGLEAWKAYRYMSYEIPKGDKMEKHQIDLYSRMDLVETEAYQMGFDGTHVWIVDPEQVYQGDPVFYHNLMFYFYAMPFVLADEGIIYFEIEPLNFEGNIYPGIGIRYHSGIGTSPEDEYFLYYDPDSYIMAWLGYTVTYREGRTSDDIHWLRYDDWIPVSDLQLPGSVTWYTIADGMPSAARNTLYFRQPVLGKSPVDSDRFAQPAGAEIRTPVSK